MNVTPLLDFPAWRARRDRRAAEALAVAESPRDAVPLLSAWPAPPEAVAALLAGWDVPDTRDVARLVDWVFGEPTATTTAPMTETDWDRAVVAGHVEGAPTLRRAAALHLVARLGEELVARERVSNTERRWAEHPHDTEAGATWSRLLAGDLGATGPFRVLWGVEVTSAFRGVASTLRLPPDVGEKHARTALEGLDLLPLGAHGNIAARVVETVGEPVTALGRALGHEGFARVRACGARRPAWRTTLGNVRTPEELADAVDTLALSRVLASLGLGRAVPHDAGLPGWGVIAAKRARLLGRLRALCAEGTSALAAHLSDMPALYARTRAAVFRWAWSWAWREARAGFGFDPDRMGAPPCVVDLTGAPQDSLGPADEDAVRCFLLLVVGRGCWHELENWLAGAPGRSLGRTFYRCLDQAPARLVDANGRYRRLHEHLADDGVLDYLPSLLDVARRVAPLPDGRGLKRALHAALAPIWDPALVAFPEHHLGRMRDAFARFAGEGMGPSPSSRTAL